MARRLTDEERCNGWRKKAGHWHPCRSRGTLFHDGERYCKTHHHPTRERKAKVAKAKRLAKYKADVNARRAKAASAWPRILTQLGIDDGPDALAEVLAEIERLQEFEGEG